MLNYSILLCSLSCATFTDSLLNLYYHTLIVMNGTEFFDDYLILPTIHLRIYFCDSNRFCSWFSLNSFFIGGRGLDSCYNYFCFYSTVCYTLLMISWFSFWKSGNSTSGRSSNSRYSPDLDSPYSFSFWLSSLSLLFFTSIYLNLTIPPITVR